MKVTMMLADFAQVADGKLTVVGGGWTMIGPDPSPFAIAVLIEVPWDRTNEQHEFRFDLVDQDGAAVIMETPDGSGEISIGGQFEVGRPPGVKRGTPISFPAAINLGPQPIPPGGRYEWRLSVNDESAEEWRLPFSTRPAR